jgi:hypothetical protein
MRHAVLITGDRRWEDRAVIRETLRGLAADTVVIHGACRGADELAGEEAERRGLPVVEVPYIGSLGRAGGPVRNRLMLDMLLGLAGRGYAVSVLAFHADLTTSRGTASMVRLAERERVAVRVIPG